MYLLLLLERSLSMNEQNRGLKAKTRKLRGTIEEINLGAQTIVVQSTNQSHQRKRELRVASESVVLVGEQPGTIADLLFGDVVKISFESAGTVEVVTRLEILDLIENYPT